MTETARRMESPQGAFRRIYGKIKREWKYAFFACLLLGLLAHMPILLSDIPNHDGLDSMHFDQNMITSGRWFLTVACGISSYYTLPWVIGLLGLVYLSCASAALCEILEIRKPWAAAACGGLLAVFPSVASTFAYVFTLDGYMLAVLLAVLAVLFTKKRRWGFLPGAACLAFSMGIYQAYLAFAMILSIFSLLMLFAEEGGAKDGATGGRIRAALRYLYMGALGAGLYYGILQVLLFLEGKELAGYQGIDGMVSGAAASRGILSTVLEMYRDFLSFTFHGNVLFQNVFGGAACILLALAGGVGAGLALRKRKCWKNPVFFGIMVLAVAALPMAANIILFISPSVNYHLLMRYQWVLYFVGAAALAGNAPEEGGSGGNGRGKVSGGEELRPEGGLARGKKIPWGILAEWAACAGAWVLIFCFFITDNIAYSNLQKRYEKTYAYCIRLLDRIEQTEGYYQGIPVAMIGVVGDEQYPPTEISLDVTANMIGMSGDGLLYRGDNYREFIRNYLGATLNILPAEAMAEMYYSDEYIEMESFPGRDSIRIIDGILYVKTENASR